MYINVTIVLYHTFRDFIKETIPFSGDNSTKLYHDLFDGYTPARPVTYWDFFVDVGLKFALYQVKSL